MLCTEIVLDIQNNVCTQHVRPMFCKKKRFWQRFTCKALKKEVDKFVDKHVDALRRPGNSSIDRSMLMRICSFNGNTASACSLMKDYCKGVQKNHLEKLVGYLQRIQQLTQEDSVAKWWRTYDVPNLNTLLFYQIEPLKNGASLILPSSIAKNS